MRENKGSTYVELIKDRVITEYNNHNGANTF